MKREWPRPSVRATYRAGRSEGYPVCCCLRFALEEWIFDAFHRDSEQALKRGACVAGPWAFYVPCGIFHRSRMTHEEWEAEVNTNLAEYERKWGPVEYAD